MAVVKAKEIKEKMKKQIKHKMTTKKQSELPAIGGGSMQEKN